MEPLTTLLGAVITQLAIHAGQKAIDSLWPPTGSKTEGGLAVTRKGPSVEIPTHADALRVAAVSSPRRKQRGRRVPLVVSGSFVADSPVSGLADDDIVLLLVIENLGRQNEQINAGLFDLTGYEMEIWPGVYHIYALILDGQADSLAEAEILAVCCPDLGDGGDPNPLSFTGIRPYTLNLLLTRASEYFETSTEIQELIDYDAYDDVDEVYIPEWKMSQIYCRSCRRWRTDIQHLRCLKGEAKSVLFLDINNYQMGCNLCGAIWTLEENTFHCPCGNVQVTEYSDSEIPVEVTDEIIATDGDIIYVLTETGTVLVGRRTYQGIAFDD